MAPKNKACTVQPHNEGHELNYVETIEKLEVAKFRAHEILRGLRTLLPSGTWSMVIESDDKEIVIE